MECFDSVKKALQKAGKAASDEQIKEIVSEMAKIRDRNVNSYSSPTEFQKRVSEHLEELKYQAVAARKEAAENILKREKLWDRVNQKAFKSDPVEAFKALTAGNTAAYSKGGRLAPGYLESHIKQVGNSMLELGHKQDGVWDMAKNGAMDRDTMNAIFEMRKGGDLSKIKSPEALKMARTYKALNQYIVSQYQAAGSSIRELDPFVMKTVHDRDSIVKAGFEQWSNDFRPMLDTDKTFGTMSPREQQNMMKDTFDKIREGRYGFDPPNENVSDTFINSVGKSANLSDQSSRGRTYHFKDGDSVFDYNQKYGGGRTLFDATTSGLNTAARNIGLMNTFGTNVDGMIEGLKTRMRREFTETSDDKGAKRLKSGEDTITNYVNSVKGLSSIPGVGMDAKISRGIRAFETADKIGLAIFPHATSLLTGPVHLASANGKGFFENAHGLFNDFVSSFTSTEARQRAARDVGYFMQDAQGEMADHLGGGGYEPGILAKAARFTTQVSGLDRFMTSLKVATANHFSGQLAGEAGTSFENLHPRLQATLKSFDISNEDWLLLSRAVHENADGRSLMTPEGVRSIPDDFFSNGAAGKLDLQSKLVSMLGDMSNLVASTPSARQSAWMGKDQGFGPILRLIGQFKQVPMKMAEGAKRVYLANPETQPTGIFQGKGDIAGLTQLMLVGALAKYAETSAKNYITKGESPEDPTQASVIAKSMSTGLFGGIYSDIVLNEMQKKGKSQGLVDAALGPALGEGNDLTKLALDTYHGKAKAADWEQNAKRQIPNIWPAKALDNVLKQHMGFSFYGK